MSQPDARLEAAIRARAAEAAPELWREALDAARAEVLAELTHRLAAELRARLASDAEASTTPSTPPSAATTTTGLQRNGSSTSATAPGLDGTGADGTGAIGTRRAPRPGTEGSPTATTDTPADGSVPSPTSPVVVAPPAGAGSSDQPPTAGLYLYGFTRVGAHELAGLTGVDGGAAFTIGSGPVRAVVSAARGSRHAWGVGGDGEPDLGELAPRLRQHEQVLQAVLARGGVLPVRFGTLYPTEDAVVRLLRSRADAIAATLDELDGRSEWGLTVRWDPQRLPAAPTPVPAMAGGSPPGRAYLDQRARDRARAELLADRRRELADALHGAIAAAADDGVVLPPRRNEGSPDEVLFRASYLVADDRRTTFEEGAAAHLAAHAELDLSGELTGPWPPYHFAHLELDAART